MLTKLNPRCGPPLYTHTHTHLNTPLPLLFTLMENGAVRSWGCAPASSRALTCPRCHGWTWLWLPAVLVLHSPLLRQPRCLPPWYWLTAMSSLPEKLRGRGREGGGRMWRGRSGGRKRNEIKEITCREEREDDKGEKQRVRGMWGIMREETRLWKRRVVKGENEQEDWHRRSMRERGWGRERKNH